MNDDPFVGRREILKAIVSDLDAVDGVRVYDITGLHGAGKSRVGEQLVEADWPTPWKRLVKMDDFNPARPGELGADAGMGAVQASFNVFERLLPELAAAVLPPRHPGFTDLSARFRIARREANRQVLAVKVENRMEVGKGASVTGSGQTIKVELDNVQAGALQDAQDREARHFCEQWETWAAGKRVLLVIDDFDRVIDQELGRWLQDLIARLTHTVVVVTRVPTQHDVQAGALAVARQHLANFTRDEVARYLVERLGTGVDDDVLGQVVNFTSGHPSMVGMICDLLHETDTAQKPSELRALLRRLPVKHERKVTALLEAILKPLANPVLAEAAKAASVVRRFGTPLLQHLLDADGERGIDAAPLVAALDAYSFTERLPPIGDDPGQAFRLHNFIRGALCSDLERIDTPRYTRLHARAAAFYAAKLVAEGDGDGDDDGDDGGYGSWFQYERASWQLLKREWLYHVAHAETRGPTLRLAFARLFLDAFWWWGVYVPFEFCTSIVDDLERVCSNDEDRQLAAALSTVLTGYPLGYEKPAGPHWAAVRLALLKVMSTCDVTELRLLDTNEQRHVFGLLNILLAHTWRYDQPTKPAADRYYDSATAAFTANEDIWNLGWVAYERADLALARHDPATAFTWCDEAAARCRQILADGDPEHELQANVLRARADAHAAVGNAVEATLRYGQAIVQAYAFHRAGKMPDDYTKAFYDEMLERLAKFVGETVTDGGVDVARIRLARLVELDLPVDLSLLEDALASAALREGRALEVVRTLFPRGPTDDELGQLESPFVDAWLECTEFLDLSRPIDAHDGA